MCKACNGKGYVRIIDSDESTFPILIMTGCKEIDVKKLLRNEGGVKYLGHDRYGRIHIERAGTTPANT